MLNALILLQKLAEVAFVCLISFTLALSPSPSRLRYFVLKIKCTWKFRSKINTKSSNFQLVSAPNLDLTWLVLRLISWLNVWWPARSRVFWGRKWLSSIHWAAMTPRAGENELLSLCVSSPWSFCWGANWNVNDLSIPFECDTKSISFKPCLFWIMSKSSSKNANPKIIFDYKIMTLWHFEAPYLPQILVPVFLGGGAVIFLILHSNSTSGKIQSSFSPFTFCALEKPIEAPSQSKLRGLWKFLLLILQWQSKRKRVESASGKSFGQKVDTAWKKLLIQKS